MSDLDHDLKQIADWRARLAALIDACDMVPADFAHDAVQARFHADGTLGDLYIDPDALTDYPTTELQQVVADALRKARASVHRLVQVHAANIFARWAIPDRDGSGLAGGDAVGAAVALWCRLEASVDNIFAWLAGANGGGGSRTYAESSRDQALALALDDTGAVLWCRLQPEVNHWDADLLADRVVRLYTLALMRARCDGRGRIEKGFGPELAADIFSKTPAAYPDKYAVKRYRQRCIDF